MGIIVPKLRQSAKGQPCTLRTPYCSGDNETTVLCHLPSDVKGTGNKSDDWHAVFGCAECHEAVDQHWMVKEYELHFCLHALRRTYKIWRDKGLIVIAGDTEKPRKPTHKIVPRRPLVYIPREGD